MPKDGELRQKWIENISKHQRLTPVDLGTIKFSVCSQHFKPEEVHKTKSRVSVNTYPTIFPQLNETSDEIIVAPSCSETVVQPVEWLVFQT